MHGLRTPREEIAFTARPKIQSQSQIFRYGGSIFCLPHRPNFSDIFDLCLHWVSVVRGIMNTLTRIFLKNSKSGQKAGLVTILLPSNNSDVLLMLIQKGSNVLL